MAIEIQRQPRLAAQKILSTLKESLDEYRWVDADQLHLTLKFLGDVPESEIPDVCRAVECAVQDNEPFRITLGTLGAFPTLDRPRVVWLGVTGGVDKTKELQGAIERELVDLGFKRDRNDFHPHVTLGRLRRGRRFKSETSVFIASHKNLVVGESDVSQVIVFSSFLDRQGATHTPMSRCQLGGP